MCPCRYILRHSEPFDLVKQEAEGSGREEHYQFTLIMFFSFLHISKHNMLPAQQKNSRLKDTGSCCIVREHKQEDSRKRGRCVEISGYMAVSSAERASRPQ